MAEAPGGDRPSALSKFYCHLCNREINSVNADYTCPTCSGGFIEEISDSQNEAVSEDIEMQDDRRRSDLNVIRDELTNLLMPLVVVNSIGNSSSTNGILAGSGSSNIGGRSSSTSRLMDTDSADGNHLGVSSNGETRRRNPRQGLVDNILLEMLQTLFGNNEAFNNASMLFLGNPGDYAWGREGIDAIVTQLLNQMDIAGPPPLPKDKIDEIPNVDITQDQVDIKLQCSVCWEDFVLCETVRKLPCLHVYHENCIIPWLELHGTCPICRKSLTPDGPEVTNPLRNATQFFQPGAYGSNRTLNLSTNNEMQQQQSQFQQQQLPEQQEQTPEQHQILEQQQQTPGQQQQPALDQQQQTSDQQQQQRNQQEGFLFNSFQLPTQNTIDNIIENVLGHLRSTSSNFREPQRALIVSNNGQENSRSEEISIRDGDRIIRLSSNPVSRNTAIGINTTDIGLNNSDNNDSNNIKDNNSIPVRLETDSETSTSTETHTSTSTSTDNQNFDTPNEDENNIDFEFD